MNQPLNEALRQSRKAKGYTQEQLAQLLHVSRQTISNWETGRASPDYELLKQLSILLETPLSTLLGVEEEPSAPPPVETVAEPAVEEAIPEPVSAPKKRWLRPVLICAFVLLAGLMAFLLTRPEPYPECPYAIQWFQQADEAVEGQPFVTLATMENPVKRSGYNDESTYNWEYHLILHEKNGLSFTVDHLESYYFWGDGQWRMVETPGARLMTGLSQPILRANTTRILTMQDTSEGPFTGVGLLLHGADAAGNPLAFRYWVGYSAEIQ